MTFKYKNVYIKDTATISGPYEKDGPLGEYFDKSYKDLYFGTDSWELAEQKIAEESIEMLLKKAKLKSKDIELVIAGDLSNQITSTTFASNNIGNSFLGVYDACATSAEELIVASSLIDAKRINNALCVTSSHNMVSEKQFRNPTEYGAPKPRSATFTSTGGASILLTSEKTDVRVESSTIGKLIDYNQKDPNNMGGAMAGAAAYTINKHLKDLGRKPEDYDLILTGDLGKYGKNILMQYLNEEYKIDISKNYNDCGVMLYDLDMQEECLAGGSGPVCSCLVNYSFIYKKLKEKEIKRVLLVPTGAMYSPTTLFQGENILSIAHAISLEVC
ncbi:MAG: stage V sporulation protein AD [bacterium]|nr:stage V sporulation protein AD [bacterium]